MIAFVVSFISPHTLPLGRALSAYSEVAFVNTMPLTEERRRMGYEVEDEKIKVYNYFDNTDECSKIIDNAECVIFAGAFGFDIIKKRLLENKLTFIMHERIFKKGIIKMLDPRVYELIRFCREAREKNVYLLSIGENSAKDFARLGFPKDKIFEFGYFPDENILTDKKLSDDICQIVWVGRMVDFKRPILALHAMRRLPSRYKLTMIGSGKLENKVENYIKRHSVPIDFKAQASHPEVIATMSSSHILLSTSDKGEGWGAVINEGMSSGCAVVCSDEIGCVNTLARRDNAVIFKSGSLSSLVDAIKTADEKYHQLSKKSLQTIKEEFNPTVAAERLFALINEGKEAECGVCSRVFK